MAGVSTGAMVNQHSSQLVHELIIWNENASLIKNTLNIVNNNVTIEML